MQNVVFRTESDLLRLRIPRQIASCSPAYHVRYQIAEKMHTDSTFSGAFHLPAIRDLPVIILFPLQDITRMCSQQNGVKMGLWWPLLKEGLAVRERRDETRNPLCICC